ncbi:phage tail tape measure protein [Edwardsiella piscicida]|uniref:phage tail tape measure protein n=1 Tax=Edwardsiella piscicida TaxID=1263550 RepID=UPI00370DC4A4
MGDVASLAVALHLNAASFKSQFSDAMRSADSGAQQFNRKAQTEAQKTKKAFEDIGVGAKKADADFQLLSRRTQENIVGFDRLRDVLANVVSGGTVAGSTITSALIPALGTGLTTAIEKSTGGLQQQKVAFFEAMTAQAEHAQGVISGIKATREQAQAQADIARKTIDAATAQREQAFALDEYLANQAQVNKEYGILLSYEKEHEQNARVIAEANLAEANAKKKLVAANLQMVELDSTEATAKKQLAAATDQLSAANQELSFSQRMAASSAGMLRGAMSLLGGPVGIGIMAASAAVTMLYSAYNTAEMEAQKFNAALMKSGMQSVMTVSDLRRLATQLGGTESAMKGVQAAVSAGFSGGALTEVADLARQIDEAGGSADELVSQLSALRDDPLRAMEQLTQQGVVLNETIIQQIAALERRGEKVAAGDLAQKEAAEAAKRNLEEQKRLTDEQTESLKQLALGWRGANVAMGEFGLLSAQIPQIKAASSSAADDKAKAEERTRKLKDEQQQALETLRTESQIAAVMKAGADKKVEAIKLTDAINARYKAGRMTADEYAQALKGVDKMYSERQKKATGAYKDDEATRRLAELKQQEVVLRQQNTTTEDLTAAEKKLLAFNQEMAEIKSKRILTASQKSLLNAEAQLRAQLQINVSLEKAAQQHQIALKAQEQMRDVAESTRQLQQEHNNKIAQMSMTPAAYDQMVEIQRIQDDFRKRKEQLDDLYLNKSSKQYQTRIEQLRVSEQEQIAIVQASNDKKVTIEADGYEGMKKGLQDWQESAGNSFSLAQDAAMNTMNSMGDAVANFVVKGKGDFRSFATSVLSDIAAMMAKMAIFNLVKAGTSLMGWASGGYTGDGGKHDVAGVVHRGEWVVPQEVVKQPGMLGFLNQLTYGKGYADGGLVGGRSPSTPSPSASVAMPKAPITLNISVPISVHQDKGDVDNTQQPAFTKEVKQWVIGTVEAKLQDAMRDGGDLDQFVRRRS